MSPVAPLDLLAEQDDWTGYGGVGDYSQSNGNTLEVLQAGHRIRDGEFEQFPKNVLGTGETYDCVIVGGGISGLAAALFLTRQGGPNPKMTCLVLDNHPVFGGEAKKNEFVVDGKRLTAHQGSAIFQVQYPRSFIAEFYESIGMNMPKLKYQSWTGSSPEIPLAHTPYEMGDNAPSHYGLYFGQKFGQTPGMWLIDPWNKKLEGAPISATARAELLKWRAGPATPEKRPQYEGDEISRRLDSMTLEQHMMEVYGISRETIRTFLSPVSGGGSGLGPDALSAYADYAAELLHPVPGAEDQMFPGGNAEFARLMVKTLIPESLSGPRSLDSVCRAKINFAALDRPGSRTRIRLSSTAVWIEHDGDPTKAGSVTILYTRGGKTYRVKARSAVMAGGCWTTKHIVRDLPSTHKDAYEQFYRSPCMMANVALRNWRFLYKMGICGGEWFEGLGNYTDVQKKALVGADPATISPDSPVVLTLKVLYSYPGLPIAEQGMRGRTEILSTPFRNYERQIRQQFTDMFSHAGFDAKRDIAGIILNRWGHAYLNPQPGFFFGTNGSPAPRETLRGGPFGRIAFANTDLAGIMDHRCSILEAHRAVGQLLDQVP